MDEDRTRVPVHFDLSVYETDAVFFFPLKVQLSSVKDYKYIYNLWFSAVQTGVYAFGNPHKLCAPTRLLQVSPNVAFETVPIVV